MNKMLNKRARTKLFDLGQQIWVSTCLAVTAAGMGYIGYEMYNYFIHVKPVKKELEDRFKEELLKEGRVFTDMAKHLK